MLATSECLEGVAALRAGAWRSEVEQVPRVMNWESPSMCKKTSGEVTIIKVTI